MARPAQARATLKGSVTIPLVGYLVVWLWCVRGITASALCCCRVFASCQHLLSRLCQEAEMTSD